MPNDRVFILFSIAVHEIKCVNRPHINKNLDKIHQYIPVQEKGIRCLSTVHYRL